MVFGEREAAETGTAHLRGREWWRHERLIRPQAIFGTRGDPDAGLVGNHGITDVVRLLHERLAFTRRDEPPDVVGAGGETFKARAVGGKTTEFALIERDLRRPGDERATVGTAHARVIEKALREKYLAAGLTKKLMREKMRVLRAETREDDVVSVGAAISIGIVIKAHVGAILHESAVFVGQKSQWHHEAIGKHAGRRGDGRLAGRGRGVGRIEDHHFIAATGGEERIGGEFLFVPINGIFEGGHRPEPHARIPGDGDKFTEAGSLRGDEFDFKTRGHREGTAFFLGRTGTTGNRVVTDIPRRGCRGGRGRRRRNG